MNDVKKNHYIPLKFKVKLFSFYTYNRNNLGQASIFSQLLFFVID